jgi:maltose alpha-D-glucosyltransferase/alpha-amylase
VSRRAQAVRVVPLADDPLWYKDAIIYELRVRSFFDSNDDGIGDFRGLASKLDYLQDLGVTAIWLLPFYPSPGKDDGYDISDYTDVHPEVGTLADFEHFLHEAHRRGLRVITELVLNHTSDQHPWFQRARRAPPGSPERDFYVWSDTPDRYRDARIIFKDFEPSNWSWDREANAYYWHRFYAHQPDLNFENPAVQEALLEVVDFWFAKGVDGMRLDAVPYLYEEEGTNCENLPKTHAFLKKLRAHIDARFKNRMLLAEANQWPEDAAAYFGDGDECHMNFHFPLMPRMFMAIHQEDRLPLIDIFAQTPELHGACQWALFLRNHDELTLEMVTDEERDYMYRAYADQAAMRINLGIRRRLAPLVGNSRRKIELLSGLLCSLPGTPVLYYGDEIGMGDNVYLGDRNGVRTPMQWSMDRNAGFSRANPQKLILPVVIDPEYHYESLNVENQQQNPTSLLWWTKRLLALRKRFAAFGRGTIEFLSPANPRVLAFVRSHGDEQVLVIANLSRFTQYAELDLPKHRGFTPVELFGKTRFPPVREQPYMLTLGPHGFYWFSLEAPGAEEERLAIAAPPPVLRGESLDAILHSRQLDDVWPAFLESRPWFPRPHRVMKTARTEEIIPLDTEPHPLCCAFVRVEYTNGESDLCFVPLAHLSELPPATSQRTPEASAIVAVTEITGDGSGPPRRCVLVDALDEPTTARAVLDAVIRQQKSAGESAELVRSKVLPFDVTAADMEAEPKKLGDERDHTTVRYGDHLLLKAFRHLDDGVSPKLELGRFLSRLSTDIAPRMHAVLELKRGRNEPQTVAILESYVSHVSTGLQFTTRELGRYYERVLARSQWERTPPAPAGSPLQWVGKDPPIVVAEMIGGYRDVAAQLGYAVAELHSKLGAPSDDPAFTPEPYSALDRRAKYQSLRNTSGRVLRMLREQLPTLPDRAKEEALRIAAREGNVLRWFEPLLKAKMDALRIRAHGTLHLGHVLYTGKSFVFTDIGGSREHSLSERRRKRSPLRDLANMVRSFDFAALRTLLDPARVREADVDVARPWAFHWAHWVSAAFLHAYLEAAADAPFIPRDREQVAVLFDSFLLERALYQLQEQLELRSPNVTVPLLAISNILGER